MRKLSCEEVKEGFDRAAVPFSNISGARDRGFAAGLAATAPAAWTRPDDIAAAPATAALERADVRKKSRRLTPVFMLSSLLFIQA
jgi:hypothetical protein